MLGALEWLYWLQNMHIKQANLTFHPFVTHDRHLLSQFALITRINKSQTYLMNEYDFN